MPAVPPDLSQWLLRQPTVGRQSEIADIRTCFHIEELIGPRRATAPGCYAGTGRATSAGGSPCTAPRMLRNSGSTRASKRCSCRWPTNSLHNPAREHCWIAERDEMYIRLGLLMRKADEIPELRLLIVEPVARGLDLSRRPVRTCIDFARETGYPRHHAVDQRRVGRFRLVAHTSHRDFGRACA